MKFIRFFTSIIELIDNGTNISLNTIKTVLDCFYDCLSFKEKLRYVSLFSEILKKRDTQHNLKENLTINRIKSLSKELSDLKKEMQK